MMINKNNKSSNVVREFVELWNSKYPLDKWWRDKYNIPFGSLQHNQQNLIDMRVDYEEEAMYGQMLFDYKSGKDEVSYEPGRGDWINKREAHEVSQNDINRDFDKLSLDNLPSIKKGEGGKRQITL